MSHEPRIYVQTSRKVNLGNYEHQEITVGLSGIPLGADRPYIQHMMTTADIAIDVINDALNDRLGEMRRAIAPGLADPEIDERGVDIEAFGAGEWTPTTEPITATAIETLARACIHCGSVIGDAPSMHTDDGYWCAGCYLERHPKQEPEPEQPQQAAVPVPKITPLAPREHVPTAGKPDLCSVCGGWREDGTMTTECPGRPINASEVKFISAGKLDFIDYRWKEQAAPAPVAKAPEPSTQPEQTSLPSTYTTPATAWNHPKGCLCTECSGHDPFSDNAKPVDQHVEGCMCGLCQYDRKPVCRDCGNKMSDDQTKWRVGENPTVYQCDACHNAPAKEPEPFGTGHSVDPHLHICTKCGGDKKTGSLTTECPGAVISAAQGQQIIEKRLDYINGGWKLIGDRAAPAPTIPATHRAETAAPLTAAPVAEPALSPPAATIPGPGDIFDEVDIFGVKVPVPPRDWAITPITEINDDGSGGGQMRALNTVLGLAGYKGKDRHWASLAATQAAFGPLRAEIGSLRELTKAEAHVILSFFDIAEPNQREALYIHAQALKGQIPLKLDIPMTEQGDEE